MDGRSAPAGGRHEARRRSELPAVYARARANRIDPYRDHDLALLGLAPPNRPAGVGAADVRVPPR
jgi:hypothetical protein